MLMAILLGLSLFYAHLRIARTEEVYKGAAVLIDRAFVLSLALGISVVAFCVGRRAARLLSLSFTSAAEAVSFSVMMGVGVIGLVVLCLGLVGLLTPLPVALALASLGILSWREGAGLFAALKEAVFSATAARLTLALLFGAVVIILALRAMTPPHSPDEAIYHLSVTKLFVQQGRVFPVVDNWAGNMPFLIQMVYAVCLLAKADIAAKLLSLSLAVVCSLALYGFSARFLTRRTGVIAVFGFFAAGMVVEVAVTARVDVSLAGMLFLAAYAMVVYLQEGRRGWLYASAMLSGFSLGIKYTAGIYLLLLGIMFVVESLLRGRGVMAVIRQGAIYSAIVAAVASPWFIKNFVWFGNPVYPFVTGELAELGPGRPRYFSAEDQMKLDAHFERARAQMPGLVMAREAEMAGAASKRVRRHPYRFWEYFISPDKYNMAEEFHYPNYLFLLAPLGVFVIRSRWLIWLGAISVAFFLATAYTSWVARLLLPVYPALTLISAHTLTELAARADRGGRLRRLSSKVKLIPAIAVAVTLGTTMLSSVVRLMNGNDLGFVKGDISRSDYMMGFYYYPPSHFINHSLPEGSRVMMIGAQTCYDLQRDYIADVNWDSTEWRRLLVRNSSVEEINEDLRRRGVTHVWVAYGLFTFVAEMGRENYPNISGTAPRAGPDYQAQMINWATLDLYSSRFLEPVYNDKFGNIIYRVK